MLQWLSGLLITMLKHGSQPEPCDAGNLIGHTSQLARLIIMPFVAKNF